MSRGRLTASVEAASLVRRAEADGDFAAVLRKGDPDRGALLIVVRSRGRYIACLERALSPDGQSSSSPSEPSRPATGESAGADTTSGSAWAANRTHWIA